MVADVPEPSVILEPRVSVWPPMLSTVFPPGATDGVTVTPATTIGATDGAVDVPGRVLVFPLTTTCVLPLTFVSSAIVVADGPDPSTIEEPTSSV